VDLDVFDDEQQIAVEIAEQVDVLRRIAVHDQHVLYAWIGFWSLALPVAAAAASAIVRIED
jgi:hypothetical protein